MSKGSKLACAVAAAALLAGCRIPVQDRPASTLALPAAWRAPLQVGPNAAVEKEWWRAFGDPVLDALVAQALAHNADLRTARSRLQEYQARIRVARSAQEPSVSVTTGPSRGRSIGPFGTPVEATNFTGNVQAAYELDPWGRLESATRAARFDYAAQQAAADAVALSVAASTASGYLNLRGLDAQLALARQTLASRQASLALARRQFEVGYSSRLEVSQSEAEYRNTAAAIPQLERSITQQENALSLLLGANPGPVARGADLAGLRAPGIAPGLPSALLRRRPDIAQAERTVAAADASLAAARDQMLPSLRLTASVGAYAHKLPDLLSGSGTLLWSVGGSVLAPLFDAGRLRAQAEISASLRDRAVFAYESVVRNAFAETENGLAAVQRLREQLEQAEARRVATAEALRIAHNRYRNGYSSYLEELDAQRNNFSAETNVLQLRASYLAAHVDLYRALGGGWTVAP
ncbi:transporter [Massilia sp. WF1]|uniref:efflux transporter outer membrane subunit n=1 Tax=unclassified Massilia TaxID=2609279 RepID=UPI0006495F4E|nr:MULTISPECIES: efflux transporter outer membrane subunit [unclassified Massilia]ALK98172.1 transporter [Massilia sp. WG5]KLU37254.1 transporter [Massilia sp. WF1]